MGFEDDPRDEVQTWPCRRCNGRGVIGDGGDAPLCPRCLGGGDDPDPQEKPTCVNDVLGDVNAVMGGPFGPPLDAD